MPRYHFNVYDGKTSIDKVGLELANVNEARRHAIQSAGEIMDDEAHRLALGRDWAMEVTDGQGLVQFRLDFMVTDAPVLRHD